MSIRFTKKVRLILDHISKYGFITNRQCASIIYKGNKQPLLQAQTKMKLLFDNGIVKREEYRLTKEFIYMSEVKSISDHKMYVMNLYAFLYNKFDIKFFKYEQSWNCKKRNDAHIIIEKHDSFIGILCEIDLFHKTSQEKLDTLYKSGEVQQWYSDNYNMQDYYPLILIVNGNGKTNLKSNDYDIECVDFDFNGLYELLQV